ncbi:MAG: VanZ family protein [Bacteroidetes bacterium]|nr:VanZ family protein [Bacteroidota bacterium]
MLLRIVRSSATEQKINDECSIDVHLPMKKRPYLSTFLWALVILILCGIPGKDIPHISFLELLSFDKWVHAGIFFVLVIFFIRSNRLQEKNKYVKANAVFIAVGLSIPYGGLIEIMQGTLFVGRSADFYDFIANSAGCFMAALTYPFISKKIPKLRLPL